LIHCEPLPHSPIKGEPTISTDDFMLSAASPAPAKKKSARVQDPVAAAAKSLVALVENHRATGTGLLTLSDLKTKHLEADVPAEIVQAALSKAPAKSRLVLVRPADPDSPVLLKEDLPALAQDGNFLKSLVQAICSSEVPVRPLNELTQTLEKSLKKLVDGYWPQQIDLLPAGLAAKWQGTAKKPILALHDERYPIPDVQLSHQLVGALRNRKDAGVQSYPSTWPDLIQSIGTKPDDQLIRRAIVQPPFSDVVREIPIGKVAWLAFREDVPPFILGESLLQRLVEKDCTPEQPEIKLKALAKQLPKDLQPAFLEHWVSRATQGTELSFASLQLAGTPRNRDALVRDRRFPPAELALVETFVKVLKSQKAIGTSSYPPSWQRLVELAGSSNLAVRAKAIKTDPFQSQIVCAMAGDVNSPVALTGDEATLAGSPVLLSTILNQLRSNDNHLLSIEKLVKHKGLHPAIRTHFQSAIEKQIANKNLPEGVGAIKVGKSWSLFLMADVVSSNRRAVPQQVASDAKGNSTPLPISVSIDATSFASDFDAAFHRLDGKLGLPHYASLVDLRPALKQYPRDVFDQELLKLRKAGRYALSLVEGRFGLSEEEHAACLIVDHVPHLLVQKK
jgi:hypothetical protein